MKTIKTIMLAVAMIMSSQLFGSYVFSWQLSSVPYDYTYAQIAVYQGDSREAVLYQVGSTTLPSRYYASYADDEYAIADITAAMSYDQAAYAYVIELYNGAGFLTQSSRYNYADLIAGHEFVQGEPGEPVDPYKVTYNIPEPTSALLLLTGLALLGLKRKARKVLVPCLLVAAMTSFGEANLTFVTLKSDGPDKYADGTLVKDGERYAVVYTANPAEVVFQADGTVKNGGTLILTSPIAKDGGCPETCFQLGENLTKDCSGGDYKLFLLDTRLADGSIAPAVNGKVPLVNGYALVEGASVQVSAISELPSDTPKVEFTDIEVGDEWVSLTMKNTVPYVQYTVDDDEASVSNGKADLNDTITITVPRKDGGQTFKARRK